MWAIAGLGLLTAGLLVLERVIVTDNERISETLDGLAAAAAANDLNGVLAYIAPDAEPVRRMATDGLRRVTVREAKIGNDLMIRITQQGAHRRPWRPSPVAFASNRTAKPSGTRTSSVVSRSDWSNEGKSGSSSPSINATSSTPNRPLRNGTHLRLVSGDSQEKRRSRGACPNFSTRC